MIDISNPEAVIAEKRRRDARRANGQPLHETPEEVAAYTAERIAETDARLEKEIQAAVRKLYLAFGCVVYSTSQARASKVSAGIPDLIVFDPRTNSAFWHECKTPRGMLSPAQRDFYLACVACGWKMIVGGMAAAEQQLVVIGAAYRDSSGSIEPLK